MSHPLRRIDGSQLRQTAAAWALPLVLLGLGASTQDANAASGAATTPPASASTANATPAAVATAMTSPAAAAPMPAAAASAGAPTTANKALGCLIEPDRAADVGSSTIGMIDTVEVERGDTVQRGQVLATLKSDVERANVDAARNRANNDGEIQSARGLRDGARERLLSATRLFQLGGSSQLDLEQAKSEYESADGRYQQALQNKRTADAELQVASAQLQQRTIRSPFAGVVVERHVQPGERVDGKPMFRVATLSPLRVEIVVPTAMYGRLKEGMSVNVTPDYPSARPEIGQVARIDRQVDAASGTFRARLRLPNPQGDIPAGLRCTVSWDTPTGR